MKNNKISKRTNNWEENDAHGNNERNEARRVTKCTWYIEKDQREINDDDKGSTNIRKGN